MTRKLSRNHSLSVVAPFFAILIVLTAEASAPPLFLPAVTYGTGGYQYSSPSSVSIADVNGDGKPDLVVTNNCGVNSCPQGTVGVLLGNGDGTFQPAVTYDSGGVSPEWVAVADVNGDGKPDLVVANCLPIGANGCGGPTPNGVVSVLLGNGDGTFQPAVSYDAGGRDANSVVVADVNGDGKPDLVVSTFIYYVGVLLGNGDGTFQPVVVTYLGNTNVASVAVADVNGDGKPDLVVSKGSGPNGLSVLLGNGDGTFRPGVAYDSGGVSVSVAIADVNGDGKPDLVAANVLEDTVGVLLGNGDGTFQWRKVFGAGGYRAQSVAVTDVNGDGKADVVVVNCGRGNVCNSHYNGVIGVLLGKGGGTFQRVVRYDAGGSIARSVAAADVNGDGRPDLAVATDEGVGLLLNAVGLSPTKTVVVTSGSPSFVRQPVTFTATVTSTNGTIPDGELVTFHDGTTTLGSIALAGGTAAYTTSSLSARTHTIKATYPADTAFLPSSGTVKQVVQLYPTTTNLSSSLNPSGYGQAVTFTATVSSAGPTPTGKVRFMDGATGLGMATLSGGVATLTKSKLAVGTHPITAQYLGDATSAKSTSSVLNQVVQ